MLVPHHGHHHLLTYFSITNKKSNCDNNLIYGEHPDILVTAEVGEVVIFTSDSVSIIKEEENNIYLLKNPIFATNSLKKNNNLFYHVPVQEGGRELRLLLLFTSC